MLGLDDEALVSHSMPMPLIPHSHSLSDCGFSNHLDTACRIAPPPNGSGCNAIVVCAIAAEAGDRVVTKHPMGLVAFAGWVRIVSSSSGTERETG